MPIKHKYTKDGREWLLIKKENLYTELHYINWVQNKLNDFRNIKIEEYKGKRYNPARFCWVVIG